MTPSKRSVTRLINSPSCGAMALQHIDCPCATRAMARVFGLRRDTVILQPIPPFRLDLTVWALRRRSRNLIDRWDGQTYRRVIVVGRRPIEVEVRQRGSASQPHLAVTATPSVRTVADRRRVTEALDRLLGLRIDLTDWYGMAGRDARLRPLAHAFRGMKPPRFPSLFEALVNAIACQQLSLEVGLTLLNRLASVSSVPAGTQLDGAYPFPTAFDVARLSGEQCREIGFSRQKTRALLELAGLIVKGRLNLEDIATRDDGIVRQRLLALRGIGRWSAEYVLLRGLGRLDVFPGDDVSAQKRLAEWLGRSRALDYGGVIRAVERWQPYAGLVYFHLLLEGLLHATAFPSHHRP
jgi:DNA-3-methyladenine glycosylase II